MDSCLPFYLSLGMTPSEYWDGDNSLCPAYRKAEDIRKHRVNAEQWRMGMYIYDAIGELAPMLHAFSDAEPKPYTDKPYPLTDKEVEERKKEQQRQKMDEMLSKARAVAEKFNRKE